MLPLSMHWMRKKSMPWSPPGHLQWKAAGLAGSATEAIGGMCERLDEFEGQFRPLDHYVWL